LDIYNRWGNLIHRQLGENAAWDGTSKGQALANDVFIYVLRYINIESQKEEVTYGDVNLIR
jgi:gliding motility-associated-like protein